MEGFMGQIYHSIAAAVLVIVGLTGCAHDIRSVENTDPIRLAETKAAMRDLWTGHIFWIRNVVLDNAVNNPAARDVAEQEVVANAKKIANSITPFYGEKASEKLFSLLAGHYGAVKDYSEATVAGNRLQRDAALAHLASNADDIAVFLSGANPHLSKDTVRGLIAAHGAHHVLQITQFKERDYVHEGETWKVMKQHVYVIADALTTALAAQFPSKFS
jgi:hypothetical protein